MTRVCMSVRSCALALATVACAQAPDDARSQAETSRAEASRPPVAVPSVPPQRVPTLPSPSPGEAVSSAVPATLIEQMREDLGKRIGPAAAAAARVVSAAETVWPDGSLGCAEPGQMYTQALVPGYRVELAAGDQTYAYHASARGFFKLCLAPGAR